MALYVLESDVVTVLHDFTGDPARLIAVLNAISATLGRAVTDRRRTAPMFARDRHRSPWMPRPQRGWRDTLLMVAEIYLRRRAELTTAALESIANHLAGIPGRKNLVWVSGAFPFVIPTDHGPQIMNREVNRATRAINSADVAVYPVDIRGLIGAFVNPATANATVQRGAPAPGPRPYSRRWRPRIRMQDTMRTIAEATGGRVYLNTNAIGEARRASAIDDSRVSYVLGYCSSRPEGDNRFRNISVKVNRSGIELRHRKGYLAAPPVRAMRRRGSTRWPRAAEPDRGIEHRPDGGDRRAPGTRGTVVVRIDPESLTWEQKKDVREAAIDVVIAQSVPDGTYFTIKETTVNLTADPERYRQMVEDGLTLSSNFTASERLPTARRRLRRRIAVGRVADYSDQIMHGDRAWSTFVRSIRAHRRAQVEASYRSKLRLLPVELHAELRDARSEHRRRLFERRRPSAS